MAAVELQDVRMVFRTTTGVFRRRTRETVALDGVSLAIEEGQLYGLLGPNGAGKTTVVKILTTLLIPTAGRASVLGLELVRDPGPPPRLPRRHVTAPAGITFRLGAAPRSGTMTDVQSRYPLLAGCLGKPGEGGDG